MESFVILAFTLKKKKEKKKYEPFQMETSLMTYLPVTRETSLQSVKNFGSLAYGQLRVLMNLVTPLIRLYWLVWIDWYYARKVILENLFGLLTNRGLLIKQWG